MSVCHSKDKAAGIRFHLLFGGRVSWKLMIFLTSIGCLFSKSILSFKKKIYLKGFVGVYNVLGVIFLPMPPYFPLLWYLLFFPDPHPQISL